MTKLKIDFYTPSIDELCDGVSFQEKIDNKWVDRTYHCNYKPETPATIRIKKLNEQDILDLGFSKVLELSRGSVFIKRNPSVSNNKSITIRMVTIATMPHVTISVGETEVVVNLIIKNKSELVWLINRLNVY